MLRAGDSEARPPAVAGSFYPADPGRLAAQVDHFLDQGDTRTTSPLAIVAPHAGYVYSGPTAGIAMATLIAEASEIDRIILLGPSHFVPLRGLALPTTRAFETPLGRVPLHAELCERLLRLPQVVESDRAHAREHSLEVLVPFLQRALGAFALVPLVVGDATPEEVAEVLDVAWAPPGTRIVVSSDLSHYHDYLTAQRLDRRTCEAIERLDSHVIGPDWACGCRALNGLLESSRRRSLEATTLDLRNSGDTAGPRDRVVGYGAWSFAPGVATDAGARTRSVD